MVHAGSGVPELCSSAGVSVTTSFSFGRRDSASSSVPASVAGAGRQRVPGGLVCQLLALGPGRLPRTGADVRRGQDDVDVCPPGRLSSRLHRSDGNNLANRPGSSQPMSGRVLASQGRRPLLAGGHKAGYVPIRFLLGRRTVFCLLFLVAFIVNVRKLVIYTRGARANSAFHQFHPSGVGK